ncbi:PREDICTED: serine/threonine-protein phosphatase 6 regulatory ankyrin repeat subunit C-like [Amphimedon queenslandica]|uniref:Uncharacterized protein n=1 Tax=Amphimedon queenslandica TaxID=400682 RepID=A0AAN0IPN7_AMPQE|nr:PREDICTED: serine/threonine-protein phosphatase 6 regulatory ankyrin repeat subunit C-like [Amphimedon queenslandica]|eukprot:XP_011405951.1 PREDICTED: serine/threonine-protein phosphatase 6 regulatory ankyrin repeat subunit C-like [Amphimedon queenslandica]
MNFEIDDLKFHLKAMNSPDYQPLVKSKKMIQELQEKITLLNMELIVKREHKEQMLKEIYETSKEIEDKVQPSQEVTPKSKGDDLQHEAQLASKTNEKLLLEEEMGKNYETQLLNSFKDGYYDDAIHLLPYIKNHKQLRLQFTIRAGSYQVEANLLHMASWNGWLGIIKDLILKYDYDLQEGDSNGNTCLHYAAMGNRVDVMKYLINEHFQFVAINKDGWTPLHTAAFYGHSEAVEYLLSTGNFDPLHKNNEGKAPLQLAYKTGTNTLPIFKSFGNIKTSHPVDSYVNELTPMNEFKTPLTPIKLDIKDLDIAIEELTILDHLPYHMWYELGLQLGLYQPRLEDINEDNNGNSKECFIQL